MIGRQVMKITVLASALSLSCADGLERPESRQESADIHSTSEDDACPTQLSDADWEKLQAEYERNRNFADRIQVTDGSPACEGEDKESVKYTITKANGQQTLTVETSGNGEEGKTSSRILGSSDIAVIKTALQAVKVSRIPPQGCQKIKSACDRSVVFESEFTDGTYFAEDQASASSSDGYINDTSFQDLLSTLKLIAEE